MDKKKIIIIVISVLIAVGILVWAFVASIHPLPGVVELQNDRTHIPEGSQTNYQYNPPTSGAHYPSWITKGFYTEPRPDGNVVHSQEHGYIIFWYDCDLASQVKQGLQIPSLVGNVYAQQTVATQPLQMTGGSEGSASASLAQLPKSFSDGSCTNFENQIKDVMNQNGMHKLIAMPRPGIDAPLILTAWGRAEKFYSIDKDKIKAFINAYRDNGPEQTDEP